MKFRPLSFFTWAALLGLVCLGGHQANAIPEVFAGANNTSTGAQVDEERAEDLLDGYRWAKGELQGEWAAVPGIAGAEKKRRTTNPRVFGSYGEIIEAAYHRDQVKAVSVSYLDRARFFEAAQVDALKRGVLAQGEEVPVRWKQQTAKAFRKRFEALEGSLPEILKERADRSPRRATVGRSRLLKTEFEDYEIGDFQVRLALEEDLAVGLVILKREGVVDHFRAPWLESGSRRDREETFRAAVTTTDNRDVLIPEVPIYLQGNRPDCGICTLGMVTHYFGLRFGIQGAVAGARVRASNLRRGDGILEIYDAFAEEAGVRCQSAPSFDFKRAQKSIESGCPVIVFRRFDADRNRMHSQFAAAFAKDASALLPAADAEDRATWPGDEAPAHASVVTGFNAERGEVIFMESWGEHVRDRRMRFEELEATSYKAFYFKP